MYYWGNQDTSVIFCEGKYREVSWIGEYYNTLSSICYILVGLFFLNSRVSKIAQGVIWIGIGSILLHGTLRYYGQWVDEGAMIVTSFWGLQHIRPHVKDFFLFPLLFIYFLFYDLYIIFLFSFGVINIYLLYTTLQKSGICGKLYILFFIIAFICWLLDKFACSFMQSYQLHAYWHLFSSIAIFFALWELI